MLKQVNIGRNAYTAVRGAQVLGVCACVLHLTLMRGIYEQLRASDGVFLTPKHLKKKERTLRGNPAYCHELSLSLPPTLMPESYCYSYNVPSWTWIVRL